MKEICRFGIRIHPFTKETFLAIIESSLQNGSKIVQNGVNAATITDLKSDNDLKEAINNSDLVNVDGMSVLLALRILGFKVPERVTSPDLAENVLAIADAKKYSIYLLGANHSSLMLCKQKIQERYTNLKIAGYHDGYFGAEQEEEIVDIINNAEPDILLLGMPSPKKEMFVEKNKDKLEVHYFLGVGGFFDILAGLKKRAPIWIQRIGMEWFYRLLQEPRRMWKRYLIGNPKFIWLVLKERLKHEKSLQNIL